MSVSYVTYARMPGKMIDAMTITMILNGIFIISTMSLFKSEHCMYIVLFINATNIAIDVKYN